MGGVSRWPVVGLTFRTCQHEGYPITHSPFPPTLTTPIFTHSGDDFLQYFSGSVVSRRFDVVRVCPSHRCWHPRRCPTISNIAMVQSAILPTATTEPNNGMYVHLLPFSPLHSGTNKLIPYSRHRHRAQDLHLLRDHQRRNRRLAPPPRRDRPAERLLPHRIPARMVDIAKLYRCGLLRRGGRLADVRSHSRC